MTFLLGGLDLEVYLDRLLKATTKKGQLLWRKKCTPDKILATPMFVVLSSIKFHVLAASEW